MKPTKRLLNWMSIGLFVAALPIVVHWALWPVVVFGWLFVASVFVADLRALSCGQPDYDATHSHQAFVGESFVVRLRLDWKLWTTTKCRLRAETEDALQPGDDLPVLLQVGPSEIQIHLVAPYRGQGVLRAIWVELYGPAGMLTRILRLPVDTGVIRVVPSLPRVRTMALQHFGAWQMRGGVRLERMRGDGSEFDALESYVPGHDPRSVDWKASARHQRLTVQRFRIERNQRIAFCLDTGHLMAESLDNYQRLDHAIHASLLLSYFALRAGDLVGLYTYDAAPGKWLPPAAQMRSFQRINQACTEVMTSNVETNHVLGLHHMLGQLRRRTLVIVFSEFTHATTAELMVETLQHMVRKHLVIFVAFDDPQVQEALERTPSTPEQMAKALVASDLLTERQRVFKRLQRAGVHVVQGPPELATVRLVARYTEIKRRALIG